MKNTRQKITDAAIEIFNEDLSAPLEIVAEKAEVTRRTLHRYFTDRQDLVLACHAAMQESCRKAIDVVYTSFPEPLERFENMLYAAIDCGVKFSFLHRMHNNDHHNHTAKDENCSKYDVTFNKFRMTIEELQRKNLITTELSVEWVEMLCTGIVTAAINSEKSGNVAKVNIKKFAWFSLSKGILV
ncbi:TetR/AcrR family transcriptional regulator [Dyadobacter sp. CY356]|uniref:TetR/AcrR family transcriptional regulator n=1 Tax=Dyadobacter sp. CY356 TaxID=2906442 RepID=UPI001F217BF2|nr:TetR family transcriptional regulator [Dyadobacter sp. CY356]MCF0057040.1 TetR family transcriptional regulator [Dyadobacter sp. CY356]